jgi:hypothetical protein
MVAKKIICYLASYFCSILQFNCILCALTILLKLIPLYPSVLWANSFWYGDCLSFCYHKMGYCDAKSV